jgi:hypothetical protein
VEKSADLAHITAPRLLLGKRSGRRRGTKRWRIQTAVRLGPSDPVTHLKLGLCLAALSRVVKHVPSCAKRCGSIGQRAGAAVALAARAHQTGYLMSRHAGLIWTLVRTVTGRYHGTLGGFVGRCEADRHVLVLIGLCVSFAEDPVSS